MGFDMIIGNGDLLLLDSLQLGGAGCYSVGSMAGLSKVLLGIWENYDNHELEKALKLQEQAIKAFKVLSAHPNGFMSAGKYLAGQLNQLPLGKVRAPLPITGDSPELVQDFKEAL